MTLLVIELVIQVACWWVLDFRKNKNSIFRQEPGSGDGKKCYKWFQPRSFSPAILILGESGAFGRCGPIEASIWSYQPNFLDLEGFCNFKGNGCHCIHSGTPIHAHFILKYDASMKLHTRPIETHFPILFRKFIFSLCSCTQVLAKTDAGSLALSVAVWLGSGKAPCVPQKKTD